MNTDQNLTQTEPVGSGPLDPGLVNKLGPEYRRQLHDKIDEEYRRLLEILGPYLLELPGARDLRYLRLRKGCLRLSKNESLVLVEMTNLLDSIWDAVEGDSGDLGISPIDPKTNRLVEKGAAV